MRNSIEYDFVGIREGSMQGDLIKMSVAGKDRVISFRYKKDESIV